MEPHRRQPSGPSLFRASVLQIREAGLLTRDMERIKRGKGQPGEESRNLPGYAWLIMAGSSPEGCAAAWRVVGRWAPSMLPHLASSDGPAVVEGPTGEPLDARCGSFEPN